MTEIKKRLAVVAIAGLSLAASSHAAFPTNTYTKTVNFADQPQPHAP